MRRILAAALGALAALLLLEGACRLGLWPSMLYRAEQARRAGAGRYRVLILGDSFVQPRSGLGRRLQGYFQSRGAVCLNLAFRGMSPLDYLRAFKTYGVGFQPDLVLFNFTTINDVTDILDRDSSSLDGWLRYRPPLARSYLLASAREGLRLWRGDRMIRQTQEAMRRRRDPAAGQVLNPFLAQLGEYEPDHMILNVEVPPAAEGAWTAIVRIIEGVQADCAQIGARLLINVFPSTEQVNRSHYAEFRRLGYRLDERMLTQSPIQDRFERLCGLRGLACNDLLPDFRARKGEEFFDFNDEHWNERGEQLASTLIIGKLESLGWSGPPKRAY